jgi:hypothetical protein
LTSEEGKKTIEDYLLVNIPTEFWGKIDYNEEKYELSFSNKKILVTVKKIIEKNSQVTISKEEDVWRALIIHTLSKEEERNYFSKLKEKLKNNKFCTNVEY